MIKYKTVYLYRDSDLPEAGWQHPCLLCYAVTANNVDYRTVEKKSFNPRYSKYVYNYVVYMCRCCEKKIKVDDPLYCRYVRRCERYISDNFP